MVGIGSWVSYEDRRGVVQAWGIPAGGLVRKSSRRRAIASGTPMILVWFVDTGEPQWIPLSYCVAIPSPAF